MEFVNYPFLLSCKQACVLEKKHKMLREEGDLHQEPAQCGDGTIILREQSGTLGTQRVRMAHVDPGEGNKLQWRKAGGDNGVPFQLLT